MKALVELISLGGDLLAEEVVELDLSKGLAQAVLELVQQGPRFSDRVEADHAHEQRNPVGACRIVEVEYLGDWQALAQVTPLCRGCGRECGGDVCMDCALPSAGVAHA